MRQSVWSMVRRRTRLVVSAIVGVAIFLAGGQLAASTRGLVGWNGGAGLYLVWAWIGMLRADVGDVRRRAAEQDEAEWVVLGICAAATLVSLAAIGLELHAAGGPDGKVDGWRLALAATTIVVSWLFIHTTITLHYARLFYGTGGKAVGGLDFPKTPAPDYADFLYFSFTIRAAAQASDVAVTSRTMRRMVLVQTILSFLFNTTVLALAINIGASLI